MLTRSVFPSSAGMKEIASHVCTALDSHVRARRHTSCSPQRVGGGNEWMVRARDGAEESLEAVRSAGCSFNAKAV